MENDREFVVAGPAASIAALEPLLQAHRRTRPVRVLHGSPEKTAPALAPLLGGAGAVLIVGGGAATPGRALPGPFLRSAHGDRIPAGWLPDAGEKLAVYAQAAAAVHGRAGGRAGPFLLLGEHDDRALELAGTIGALMPPGACVVRWTAERLPRAALIDALGVGAGAALYVGHGAAGGWAGYGGFGVACARRIAGHPLGAVLSLCCSAASRPRRGPSFCEALTLGGHAAAAFGAVGKTLHRLNAGLGVALARALAEEDAITLGGLLLRCAAPEAALCRYRIIGDPLAPIVGAPDAAAAARAVFAPGADDPLPIVPLSAWTLGQACSHSL